MTYGPFRKNKNPCKEGFLPMSAGNGLLGGQGCTPFQFRLNTDVWRKFHLKPCGVRFELTPHADGKD